MKVVRKFNEFVKKRINENVDSMENPYDMSPELETGMDATRDAEMDDQSNLIDEPEKNFEEEEEEEDEYKGNQLMNELADILGVEVINNQIDYNGHEIHFYSETENFHIDNMRFENIEEVVAYLEGEDQETTPKMELEPALESRRFKNKRRR
jgi:hypothetical protein